MKEEIILRIDSRSIIAEKDHSLGKLILNQSLKLRCERNYLEGLIAIAVLNFKIPLHINLKMWLSIHTLRITGLFEKTHEEAEDDTCSDKNSSG